jgi:hypothetical protein
MATTLFFSLLPDVDTDSLPRRWFYRAALAALLWLAWKGQWKQATALAVLSTLPLVDHHRGWTHWRWSPVLGGVVLSLCYLWWCGRLDGVVLASQLLTRVEVAFLLAAACGWYTHLVLDGLLRLFPPDPL